MENTEKQMTELENRLKKAIASAEEIETSLYKDDEDEANQKELMERIEQGYKSLNKNLSKSEHNRWGYSPAGWMSKKLLSKHMNSMKNGLFSIFPIPCKAEGCPYAATCIAVQNDMAVPGEPCILEVNKIENLIVSYAHDFKIENSSTSDRSFIQELVQLDIMMDRCQRLMTQDNGNPMQDVIVGTTEDGTPYTQPVTSRIYETWERMAKRRQVILDEMMATRKSRKDIKEEPASEEDVITHIISAGNNFFDEEEVPEQFRK